MSDVAVRGHGETPVAAAPTEEAIRRSALALALVLAGVVTAFDAGLPPHPGGIVAWDAGVYWNALANAEPYAQSQVGVLGSYLYSPAFLDLLAPARLLGWHAFLFVWTSVLALAGLWLLSQAAGRIGRIGWLLATAAVLADLWAGNVHLLLGVATVLALRAPAGWAVPLLTKVTPAVGVVWHLARREWTALASAVLALGAIVAISAVADGSLWLRWLDMLMNQDRPVGLALPIPLAPRVAAALLMVGWAAASGRAWVVPVATWFALPAIWPTSVAMLVAAAALREPGEEGADPDDWVARLRDMARRLRLFRRRTRDRTRAT